ncbi:hypothetical protein SEPCBS57363_003950 [Sporothrix epigloea]|uniref:Uncharacterized protein n=1 Tax=Sporothrix epigloea TaxID=1892477 RepID=A0ABP0DPD7_9PEZI
MASAAESTDTAVFHLSHSTPDLVLPQALTTELPSPSSNQHVRPAQNASDYRGHTAGTPAPAAAAPTVCTKLVTTSIAVTSTRPSVLTPDQSSLSSPSLLDSSSKLRPLPPYTASPASNLRSKSLPNLPAFDVPAFDFGFDLDAELVLQNFPPSKPPAKPESTPEPPRRIWEDFITAPGAAFPTGFTSTSSTSTSIAGDIEAKLAFDLGLLDTSFEAATTTRSPDKTTSLLVLSTTTGLTKPKRPSSAVTPLERQKAIVNEYPTAAVTPEPERPGRRKTLVDRPLSWLHGSRSQVDFTELLKKERAEEARRARPTVITGSEASTEDKNETIAAINRNIRTATAQSVEVPALAATLLVEDGDSMVEQPKSVSASFAGFARRSWMPRSSSSSLHPPKYQKNEKESKNKDVGKGVGRFAHKRLVSTINPAISNSNDGVFVVEALPKEGSLKLNTSSSDSRSATSDADGGKILFRSARTAAQGANANCATAAATPSAASPTAITTTTTIPTDTIATSSTASTSRSFGRASTYLNRMKQRPQSMFVKVASDKINNGGNHLQKQRLDEGEGNGRTVSSNRIFSATLSSLLLPGGGSDHSGSSSSSRNSDDGSSDRSAHGSRLLPESEAESLTTAHNSNAGSQDSPMTHPTSRDPLWVAFKDLETNFFKFLSKTTTAQRMILVRATLIPFLRRYVAGGSNPGTSAKVNALLVPEDIERRASILNRWWMALLEMLDGPSQAQSHTGKAQDSLFGSSTFFGTSTTTNGTFHAVTGVDRPVVLECMSLIMSRPEWRLLTAVFRPLAERSPGERVRARANTADSHTCTAPDESAFLVEESAEHNVRTMFINNLLAQLVLMVNKMALRQAPISIVNFAGKACAYAFFFVPGVADILIRLWSLDKNIELVRRMADTFGLPRRSKGESEDLVALFPPNIGPLGWTSVNAMQAKLRRPPRMDLLPPAYVSACSRVSWFAPSWLSRWRGADTDLLFVFCKYYHVLADEFMPASLQLPLVEKARAPGFVLLHAQLLQIFDSTIHRQAAVEAAMLMAGTPMTEGMPTLWMQQQMKQRQPYLVSSVDDAFVPSFIMQPSHNLFRDMDENRIIALLRDLLTSSETLAGARATFASTTMVLLKAATLRTSQYDHSGCYILCDFLHGILQVLDNYYGYSQARRADEDAAAGLVDFVDWTFWLDVCKMMLKSNNTMSEIRVLSFVFSTWDIVAADPGRKEALCVDWLLTEEVFNKFFNNWCPMVRAYYMRVLCWRVCRDAGSSNELDAKIFQLVSQRLQTVWSHYLWLKNKADADGVPAPSTAPSLPQPGKRFMIVRTEVTPPQPGLFVHASATINSGPNGRASMTFDSLASSVSGINSSATAGSSLFRSELGTRRHSLAATSTMDDKKTGGGSAKVKWSLLGRVLNLASKPPSDEEFEQMRNDTALAIAAPKQLSAGPTPPPKSSLSYATPQRLGSPPSDSSSSTGSTPVFDAPLFVFKFALHSVPWQGSNGGQGEVVLPPAYRDHVLSRPRLPAPAQARVSAHKAATGNRSESPPPPAAGLPPITRRISGLNTGGLINEARNANPADAVPHEDERSSAKGDGQFCQDYYRSSSPLMVPPDNERDRERKRSSYLSDDSGATDADRDCVTVQPAEPKGRDAMLRATYSGRALAEWGLVVSECNAFIDRRREDGVYGLKDVEVPTLGVEGMRRFG